jgi:hypothetical protein
MFSSEMPFCDDGFSKDPLTGSFLVAGKSKPARSFVLPGFRQQKARNGLCAFAFLPWAGNLPRNFCPVSKITVDNAGNTPHTEDVFKRTALSRSS